MATIHKVFFYPVGNGDTSLVVLSNGRRVLFDYCHRRNGEDQECPLIDLKSKLNQELADANRDDYDVVAFTCAAMRGHSRRWSRCRIIAINSS